MMVLKTLDEEQNSYQGSHPLYTALADRFAYIMEIPEFNDFSLNVRKDILYQGAMVLRYPSVEVPGLVRIFTRSTVWEAFCRGNWPIKSSGTPILKRHLSSLNISLGVKNRQLRWLESMGKTKASTSTSCSRDST